MDNSITKLKGIGPKRAEEFKKLNILSAHDLIEFFPRAYEDKTVSKTISQFAEDGIYTFPAYIVSDIRLSYVNKKALVNARISDGTGSIYVTWFNKPYLKKSLRKGDGFLFSGKVENKSGHLSMISPELLPIPDEDVLYADNIQPIYPLSGNLTQKIIRGAVKELLTKNFSSFEEFIPASIRKEYNLCEINFALENIHFPSDKNALETARYRLIFEEFFLIQVLLIRLKKISEKASFGIKFTYTDTKKLENALPFSLTKSQRKVIREIKSDLSSGKIMNRLIQGDVGSGKTAVAEIASYMAVKNGFQAALMAPTELLAKQHFQSFSDLFSPLGISCILLTGSMSQKEKNQCYEEISSGNAQIIIGTHALIQKKTSFFNLGLVISDEQHRFGVNQRKTLSEKGENTHSLIMTATPIPRTLALMLYGNMSISSIKELPPGRVPIKTYCVNSSYRQRFFNFIKEMAKENTQAYIICPLIETSENSNLESVMSYIEMAKKALSPLLVEAMHGKMSSSEKQTIMENFAEGKIDVLVSTTVIEVGINVPNASIIIIENAERFGLSQLHQLRGRVGRGRKESFCILVTDSKTEISQKRMEIMKNFSDGFTLSEKDLDLRGPGDFFGTSQHGLPNFKLANIYRDIEILKAAKSAAEKLISSDLFLENAENKKILDKIQKIHNSLRIDI